MNEERPKTNIAELFKHPSNGKYLKVAAPMVRYSKLEFRALVRKYKTDLCFTPMIVANSFLRSEKARKIEFTTNIEDTPLIAQYAANCTTDFLHGAQIIQKYCDGVDLNCGCPQSWAKRDGYGCYLLKNLEVIEDMMKTVRRNLPNDFSVSLKIRLLDKDIKNTVDLCRQLEALNVTFITVHGRTPSEKASKHFPVDVEAVAEIKKSLSIPVIFNGDVKTLQGADRIYEATKCDGIMAARNILSNPALFAGYKSAPLSCVQDWIDISLRQDEEAMTYQTFHHHLVFMTEHLFKNKRERSKFNNITEGRAGCYEFIKEKFNLEPKDINYPTNLPCTFDDTTYKALINDANFWSSDYSSESSHGKFFLGKLVKSKADPNDDYLDMMDNCNDLLFS